MDHVEKISTCQSIQQSVMVADTVLAQKRRPCKLLPSPNFGHFDFIRSARAEVEPVCAGVHHFFCDEGERKNLVYDWRAPISTIFHDHEVGPAPYAAPSGEVQVAMLLKHQCIAAVVPPHWLPDQECVLVSSRSIPDSRSPNWSRPETRSRRAAGYRRPDAPEFRHTMQRCRPW